MVTLQRNKYTVDGVYGLSNGQLTKCDLVLILRSPLTIRHHLNAEWEIWNSTVHKSDAVWYEYCQLHLSSLRSWRGEICCAAPALMNKINISCGKRFAGWTQEMHLACRVGTAEILCSAWTILGNSQPTSQPASQPTKTTFLEPRENLQWRRWVPIKHPPVFLYLRSSGSEFYIFLTSSLVRYMEHVSALCDLMHLKVPHYLLNKQYFR